MHLPPSDLFQEKAWSEQAIFLKEAIISGNIPDFSFKYQHDPHSVAQFLYELLASSDKGILNKVGQGLVDSVDIDLSVYTGNYPPLCLSLSVLLSFFIFGYKFMLYLRAQTLQVVTTTFTRFPARCGPPLCSLLFSGSPACVLQDSARSVSCLFWK